MTYRCGTGVLALLLVCAFSSTACAELVLVDEDEPRAVVIVPDEPTEVATYAADELVHHVEKATGAALPIVNESEASQQSGTRIYIGSTNAAKQAGIDPASLPPEVAVLRTTDDALYIVGHDKPGDPLDTQHVWAGTLWGVYEVLERELNVRWLWPGELGTRVPKAQRLVIGELDERIEPKLERRRLRPYNGSNHPRLGFTKDGRDAFIEAQRVFLRRHRMGQSRTPTPFRAGHSFGNWWERYGEEHPEWFAQRLDGGRGPAPGERGHRTAMCVSNPELHKEIVRRFAQSMKENPDRMPRLSIGENDVHVMCACETCRSWDDPQPTEAELAEMPRYPRGMYHPFNASARYARYWKEVYELAKEVEPDVFVVGFAYSTYFPAPQQDIELNENIIVGFVPWAPRGPEMPQQRSFWFPRHEDEQQWVMEQWDGWQATGARVYYRPNYTLDGYAMPHVYTHQVAEVFQHYARNGMVGSDFDSLIGQWSAQGPTLYLLARLQSRPTADVEALLDAYYNAFGPASEHVRDYFAYWEKHTKGLLEREDEILKEYGTRRLNTYPRFAHEFFPPDSFERAEAILDKAAAATKQEGTETHQQRVSYLRDGMKHARLCVEVAALFADDSATAEQRRKALNELADFRHAVEGRFIANYHWLNRQERISWGDMPGFFDQK